MMVGILFIETKAHSIGSYLIGKLPIDVGDESHV